MKPAIKSPEIQIQELIYNPMVLHKNVGNIQVMRIEKDEKYTRIDFAYHADSKYINGGWVQIHSTCYIKPINSNIKLNLVKAVNIPIAPRKHYFKSTKDCLYYTLYFQALSPDTKAIDIIEMDTNDPSFFNFYGVSVERIKKEFITIYN